MRTIITFIVVTICISSCSLRTKSKVNIMLTKSFLDQWGQYNASFINSCVHDRSGMPYYYVLQKDRINNVRYKLIKELLRIYGNDYKATRISIVEYSANLAYKEHLTYNAAVWFDDEDKALLFYFNDETSEFRKEESDYFKSDEEFFNEPELGCCYKYDQSTVLSCSYLSVFEANDKGVFDFSNFCIRYRSTIK
jgi:hypothetical protein